MGGEDRDRDGSKCSLVGFVKHTVTTTTYTTTVTTTIAYIWSYKQNEVVEDFS